MEKHRGERLREALREEVDEIINYELEDPRIDGVQITDVLLSHDGRRAIIQCLFPDEAGDGQEGLAALDRARHHIRELAMGRLSLFRMPELRFEADPAQHIQQRAGRLLRRVRKGRPKPEPGEFNSAERKDFRK